MNDELIKRLKEAAQAATPQNLDTAQTVERYEDGSHITCPTCDGEGYAELNSDFCNYDGKAIGVQFYGIGPEHLAAEAYFRAASPAAILDLIALIEQQAAALEAANARIAELESERDAMMSALAECRDAMPIPDAGAPIEGHWASAMADPLEVPGYIRAALAQPLEAQADARWQPIETAPKFGEPIDVWGRYGRKTECVFGKPTYAGGLHWIYEAGYDSNGPVFEIVVDPTHWMAAPAAPAALSQKAGEQQ